ncbi:MAG: T9SS type A sorting domain-containing protein, partial [Bacteroidaceae bacterium]|nr:T9SS type A sorting domain-containing protein [Bacteroidaceae bacterium]
AQSQVYVDSLGFPHIGSNRYTDEIYNFNINDYNGLIIRNKVFCSFKMHFNGSYPRHLNLSGDVNNIDFMNTASNIYNNIQVGSIINAVPTSSSVQKSALYNGLEKINAITPVTLKSNQASPTQYGFSTESITKEVGNLTIQDEKGRTLFNEQGLIPLLIEALQSLNKQSELQKASINALEEKMTMSNKFRTFEHFTDISTATKENCTLLIPNPIKSNAIFTTTLPSDVHNASLRIINLKGQRIADYDISGSGIQQTAIDVNTWESGCYLCSLIVNGNLIVTKKIYKE